jgi:hypothetical protein
LKVGFIGVGLIIAVVVCAIGVGALGLISLPDIDSIFNSNPGGAGTAPVLVQNNSSYEICYVLISPSNADDWGVDWLGDNETIPSGSEHTFYVTSNQSIDMQLLDCDQMLLDEQYGVMLDDDGITYTLEDFQ